MKVLLSAYACEPGKGSEPGVGWMWAIEAARQGHQVWVVTRANNRTAVEAGLAALPAAARPQFLYYDLPRWAAWWKRGGRGIRLYYTLWQWGAYRAARDLHARERFDLVHHITFGVLRHPSFMGRLGARFLLGPLGGGEAAPWRLRRGFGWRGWAVELARDVANLAARMDPLVRSSLAEASVILAKTRESRAALPEAYRAKTEIQLEIGIEPAAVVDELPPEAGRHDLRLLFVGRFLYWKGGHLALRAFAHLAARHGDSRLTLVGRGPDEARWRRLADGLAITQHLQWIPWLERDALRDVYLDHDALLFPSLHDSSGNVVLEAMANGLPVLCLDLGGPGAIVDETCGRVIATAERSEDAVVAALGDALVALAADPAERTRLAGGALRRVQDFRWDALVERVYDGLTTPATTERETS